MSMVGVGGGSGLRPARTRHLNNGQQRTKDREQSRNNSVNTQVAQLSKLSAACANITNITAVMLLSDL